MFVFVVPFKSRQCCADWSVASRLCVRAVNSMLRQETADVKVVLACHEPPEGLQPDPRLIVNIVDSQRPRTRDEMMLDKYFKIHAGLVRAREFAPTWLMRADADDLISRKLARFLERQAPGTAWYSETGWAHRSGSRWAMKVNRFHLACGTSCVTYATEKDLPARLDEDPSKYYLLTQGHHLVVDYLRGCGVPTHPIPFATTIYESDTGENWSGPWLSGMSDRRLLIRKLLKSRFLTADMRDEFGLNID